MKANTTLLLFIILTPVANAAPHPCEAAKPSVTAEALKKSCDEGSYCNADGHLGTTPAAAVEKCTGSGQKYGTCVGSLKCEGKVIYCNEKGYAGPLTAQITSSECTVANPLTN